MKRLKMVYVNLKMVYIITDWYDSCESDLAKDKD